MVSFVRCFQRLHSIQAFVYFRAVQHFKSCIYFSKNGDSFIVNPSQKNVPEKFDYLEVCVETANKRDCN